LLRIGPELVHAAGAAEIVVRSCVFNSLGRIGGHLHATDRVGKRLVRILRGVCCCCPMCMVCVMLMPAIVMLMATLIVVLVAIMVMMVTGPVNHGTSCICF